MSSLRTPLLSTTKNKAENTAPENIKAMDLSKISSELRYEIMLSYSGNSFAALCCLNKQFKEQITPSKLNEISFQQCEYYMTYLQCRIDSWPNYIKRKGRHLENLLDPLFYFLSDNHPFSEYFRNAIQQGNLNNINNAVSIASQNLYEASAYNFHRKLPRIGIAGSSISACLCVALPLISLFTAAPGTACATVMAKPLTISGLAGGCGTFTSTFGILHCLKPGRICEPENTKNATNAIEKFSKESKLSVIPDANLLLIQLRTIKSKKISEITKDRFGAFVFFKGSRNINIMNKALPLYLNNTNSKIAEFLGCHDLPTKTKFTT